MSFVHYPSISSFRQIQKYVPEGTVFHGHVKLHGTNGGINFLRNNGNWELNFQSRNRILTAETDNHSFYSKNKGKDKGKENIWRDYLKQLNVPAHVNSVVIFGEWCGKKINGNVGVCELDHFFYIFDIFFDETRVNFNLYFNLDFKKSNVFSIHDSPVFTFKSTESFDIVTRLTEKVEANCPMALLVAKRLNIQLNSKIGEGIVWRSECGKFFFKSKGNLHASNASNASTGKSFHLKPKKEVDPELLERLIPIWRLAQGTQETETIPEFIEWLKKDIKKEEGFVESKETKSVFNLLNKKAVSYFKLNKLN